MATYVMSDIHGAYEEFCEMLSLIKFDKTKDTIIINGDLIDRGSGSIELIELMLCNKESIIWIKGNHEDMMINAMSDIADYSDLELWLNNGGCSVYTEIINRYTYEQTQELINIIRKLPLYIIKNNCIITHANIKVLNDCSTAEELMSQQDRDILLWDRSDIYNSIDLKGYTAILGHTPVQSISKNDTNKIIKMKNKIYIDCGVKTYATGQLGCLCLETMEEFYIPRLT